MTRRKQRVGSRNWFGGGLDVELNKISEPPYCKYVQRIKGKYAQRVKENMILMCEQNGNLSSHLKKD